MKKAATKKQTAKKRVKKQSAQIAAGYKRDRTIRMKDVAQIADQLDELVAKLRKIAKVKGDK